MAVADCLGRSASVDHDDVGSLAVAEPAQRTVLDRYVLDPKSGPPAEAIVTHTLAGGVLVHGCAERCSA